VHLEGCEPVCECAGLELDFARRFEEQFGNLVRRGQAGELDLRRRVVAAAGEGAFFFIKASYNK